MKSIFGKYKVCPICNGNKKTMQGDHYDECTFCHGEGTIHIPIKAEFMSGIRNKKIITTLKNRVKREKIK
jgi:DnaJ-class molecular chaperone